MNVDDQVVTVEISFEREDELLERRRRIAEGIAPLPENLFAREYWFERDIQREAKRVQDYFDTIKKEY